MGCGGVAAAPECLRTGTFQRYIALGGTFGYRGLACRRPPNLYVEFHPDAPLRDLTSLTPSTAHCRLVEIEFLF